MMGQIDTDPPEERIVFRHFTRHTKRLKHAPLYKNMIKFKAMYATPYSQNNKEMIQDANMFGKRLHIDALL